ncbi:MAG: HEAT repeat domain-containing protein [Desulfococcaceae bacterium]|jgi:hypothetical protein|nr:HEAT repeat domain-containing protein [Desulfococcaceae bacterium]
MKDIRLSMHLKKYHVPTVFTAGMLLSQILSVFQVYLSNLRHYEKIRLLYENSYLPVPSLTVPERFTSLESAFWGGMFFCLTTGFGITFFSFSAARIWDRFFSRKKTALYPFLLFWTGCLLLISKNGFSPLVSLHFLLLPPPVFFLTLRFIPPVPGKSGRLILLHIVCLALLAVIAGKGMGAGTFSLIRDRLLLSHPAGLFFNNAYYRYTLYAAQVFKNLRQDQLKTCRIENPDEIQNDLHLKQRLARYDYLTVPNGDKDIIDLVIRGQGKELIFRHRGQEILRCESAAFFRNTGDILKKFSRKTDRHVFFRSFTFISLLLISGLTVWMLLWLPIRILCGFFAKAYPAAFFSPVLSFLTAVMLLIFWHPGKTENIPEKEMGRMLHSPRLEERIRALQSIRRQKREIAPYGVHERMSRSPHITERYYLIRALSVSRSPDTYAVTLALADDPQINVAYRAFHALGARRDGRAVPEILERIQKSREWYIQMYAYKALRKLGWTQKVSP